MSRNKSNRFTPLLMAVSVVAGILIGTFYANHFSGNRLSIINSGSNRLNNLLRIIDDQYVDTVNIDDLVDKAIPQILAQLDPHSVYISKEDVQKANSELKGSFSGVGVEFTIQRDTINVGNVVKGGPAEKAGILAGDKIVEVDGKPFVGEIVTDTEARHRLMGPKGTKVVIGVRRYGSKAIKRFTVTRADIVTPSISATYMINDSTGYMRIKSFGQKTYMEMLAALASLSQQGFTNLIIDLRDNTGGYLESAIQMADEFLPKDRLIVYTQGRKSPRRDYRSSGRGAYQSIPLVVLINEATASSAEIFSGAMQDNDRGTIVGRRSFGKGLVQQQVGFPDGSEIRLTVARYYTPAGRCIQKPYKMGDEEGYEQDIINRYEHGEFFSQDSIRHAGPAYHTRLGRSVYGGGGITPDIFVAEDTSDVTSYYKQAVMSGLVMQFAFNYIDANRPRLRTLGEVMELVDYVHKQNLVEQFATFGSQNGLPRRNLMIRRSHRLLERFIDSRIVYNMFDEETLMKFLNQDDPTVEAALKVFARGEAFPKAPKAKGKAAGKRGGVKSKK